MKSRLDPTALVHIGMMNDKSINVYRISITMKSPVVPERLQKAADRVAGRYPMICCRMSKDCYWCYSEPLEKITVIKDEKKILESINKDNIFQQAVNIIYSGNKIIFEAFHSVADGFGAFTFLNALVREYIALSDIRYDMPYLGIAPESEFEDSFAKHGTASDAPEKVVNITNPYYFDKINHDIPLQFTTFRLNLKEFKKLAKSNRCTLNELLLVMIYNAIFTLKGTDGKDVVLAVPINLRNKFESSSLKNFIHIAKIGMRKSRFHKTTEEMVKEIRFQLHRQNNKDYLHKAISRVARLHNSLLLKFSPLWLKSVFISAAVALGYDKSCMTVSNLGDLSYMLPDVAGDIEYVDTMLSPRPKSPYNCCISSIGDYMNVTFTHATAEDKFISAIHGWLGENSISYTTQAH